MSTTKDENHEENVTFRGILKWVWRQFNSIRLAVILILIITALSLLGALLIQAPQSTIGDPQYYSYWVETVAEPKLGGWASFFSALQLFNVFRSPWFVIAGIMLMVNIFVCSINRWSSIRVSLQDLTISRDESFYTSGNVKAELTDIPLSPGEAGKLSQKVLGSRGYRTKMETGDDSAYISADKNRYYRLGTYLSHFSLILFVLAFVSGNYFGFSDSSYAIPEGTVMDIGYDTGLSIYLESFTDEYYESGIPKDYRSEVILFEQGQVVEEALIRVNHPLVYKGIRIYQSYYGPAVNILVQDSGGETLYEGAVALTGSFDIQGLRYFEGYLTLPVDNYSVRIIIAETDSESSMVPAGQVAVDLRDGSTQVALKLLEAGVPRTVGELDFTYTGDSQYSGFQVRKDPTNILVWIASTLFTIGICAVFYFPYRQVRILLRPDKKGSRIYIRIPSARLFEHDSEISAISDRIMKEIPDFPGKGEQG